RLGIDRIGGERSQKNQHVQVSDADAVCMVGLPRQLDAERRERLDPAGPVDGLRVGKHPVKIEQDGVVDPGQLESQSDSGAMKIIWVIRTEARLDMREG